MDNLLDDFPNSWNNFHYNPHLSNGFFNVNREIFDPLHHNSSSSSSSTSPSLSPSSTEGNSPDCHDTSNTMLKYITEMLMDEEEDLKTKPCMLIDCLALQAAEKSFYDVLGKKYPPSPIGLGDSTQNFRSDLGFFKAEDESESFNGDSSVFPPSDKPLLSQDSLFGMQYIFHFRQGAVEASKFLPVNGKFGTIDLDNDSSASVPSRAVDFSWLAAVGDARSTLQNGLFREKKNHQREDSDEELRSTKQSATFADDSSLSELFDELLLCRGESRQSPSWGSDGSSENESSKKSRKKTKGKKNRSRKQESCVEVVDLWTLLIQCAQAVSNYDQRTANELLNQIRHHSNPSGDGNQRLAYFFAKGLETRLAAGTPLYMPFASNETSAADILKTYQMFIKACPFRRMSYFYANRTILKLAENVTRLHIVDFGILYGLQWPCLIQRLSDRPGGPPKLRITGIELPQPGFRPAERVEQTGRRLAHYCKRFNVPFEHKVLAQKWETVKYEDLNVNRDELTIVTCMFRMKNVPDETVVANSPRDKVLKLIRKINPDLFIHEVTNGSFNTPFFNTRFKEALFYYSSLFDMYEATVPRDNPQRYLCEREILGRDIMNVIACEGLERVERPETYKQWQVRNTRAGFKQVPLDQELLKNVEKIVNTEYHQDFAVDQDGAWMLQGWKGRIIDGLSCWVVA
ncbi:scarecrow-like protein 30 isoform X1 [Cucurbita moschata]|uniref:Scarecrow-like protein 30 isoform X1 n=1 Tax=Cucurbita moschata TaxID=3662 RepID=A0A6J1G966_CUCMO|nr:scarecrow-like protein 30 isoform X1 [Cucurbita moschata]